MLSNNVSSMRSARVGAEARELRATTREPAGL